MLGLQYEKFTNAEAMMPAPIPVIMPTPSSPGVRVVTCGTGKTVADGPALVTYIAAQKPKTNGEMLIIEVYNDLALNYSWLSLPNGEYDADHYCIVRPVPGTAASDLVIDVLDYGLYGTEIQTYSECKVGHGVVLDGFRIDIKSGNLGIGGPDFAPVGAQVVCGVTRARVKVNGGYISLSEYNVAGSLTDSLIVRETGGFGVGGTPKEISRCAFVVRNGATGLFLVTNDSTAHIENNVMIDAGPDGMSLHYNNIVAGNYTNSEPSVVRAGITSVTNVPLVVNPASDLRPAVGSPLLGNAVDSAISTPDIRSKNRGLNPDVGPWQLVPATPLPTGIVTGTPTPSGQQWTIDFATTQNPTSAMASLAPASANPGGAIGMQGTVTLGTGTGQAVFSDITPGNYKGTITIGNDGGFGSVSGIPALSILEVTGTPTAGATQGGEVPTPTVESVIVSPATATGSTQFTAQALGQNSPPQTFTWTKVSGGGALSGSGAFIAPAQTNSVQVITIKAASTLDPNVFGTATVTIPALVVVTPPDDPPPVDPPGTVDAAPRFARPASDVTKGQWVPSSGNSLFAMVKEAVLNLDDYISASVPTTCEIALGPVADPGTSGSQAVRYEAHAPDGGALTVRLKQGSTVIATRYHAALPVLATIHELVLTSAECDAITDYGNLRVELVTS